MFKELSRERTRQLRREVAGWQKGAIGLLALSTMVNTVLIGGNVRWEKKYRAAVQIEREAIAAYADLNARVEAEKAARAEAEAAYAKLEGYAYMSGVTITYYCCEPYEHICGTGDGITASGLPVAPGMVAVDPAVIPLGSTVIIDGMSYLAADTGVTGNHIDVAVPTHDEALTLGTTQADVWVVQN